LGVFNMSIARMSEISLALDADVYNKNKP
jgi:hypothetical protein